MATIAGLYEFSFSAVKRDCRSYNTRVSCLNNGSQLRKCEWNDSLSGDRHGNSGHCVNRGYLLPVEEILFVVLSAVIICIPLFTISEAIIMSYISVGLETYPDLLWSNIMRFFNELIFNDRNNISVPRFAFNSVSPISERPGIENFLNIESLEEDLLYLSSELQSLRESLGDSDRFDINRKEFYNINKHLNFIFITSVAYCI